MKQTITQENLKRLFNITDDRTFNKYIERGYFKEMIISNNIVYDVEHICDRLGIEDLSEPLLTSEEVAKILGTTNKWVINMANKSMLPCYKFEGVGKRRLFFLRHQIDEHKKLKVEFKYEIINRFYKLVFYRGILMTLLEAEPLTADLTPTELEVMKEYFIDNDTFQKIGNSYGFSKQYICEVIESASNKLLNKVLELKETLNKQ